MTQLQDIEEVNSYLQANAIHGPMSDEYEGENIDDGIVDVNPDPDLQVS